MIHPSAILLLRMMVEESGSISIPLPMISTTAQAENTQSWMADQVRDYQVDLEIRRGRWYLVVSRQRPAKAVPYDN